MSILETTLNLIWAALAVAAFVLVLPRAAAGGRKLFPAAVALACLVLLLFPIISVTDDMISDRAIAEEWNNASRRMTSMVMHSHDLPQVRDLAVVLSLILQLSIITSLRVIGFIEAAATPAHLLPLTASTDPRSPPRR